MSDTMEPILKLDADLKAAARLMGQREVRFLCDLYYQLQDFRKASANMDRSREEGESGEVVKWLFGNVRRMEGNVQRALGEFSDEYRVGKWLMHFTGIGPVLSAGLLAHFDIRGSKVAGRFLSFAGLDPTKKWHGKAGAERIVKNVMGKDSGKVSSAQLAQICKDAGWRLETVLNFLKGEEASVAKIRKILSRCPWNAKLKKLLYLWADCQVKFRHHPEAAIYGMLYDQRKEREIEANERGDFADQARIALESKNYGADTEARKWYECGKLPPARIHLRAMRKIETIFVSHLHHVMYEDYYGTPPPFPYAFDKLDHNKSHYIPVPEWNVNGEGRSLKDLYDRK